MPEKPTKKTVAVSIKRARVHVPKIVVATGFKLRPDKSTGMIDILFEVSGQKGERVVLDPSLLASNLDILKRYVAQVPGQQDDSAKKDDVPVSEGGSFANIIHVTQMGGERKRFLPFSAWMTGWK